MSIPLGTQYDEHSRSWVVVKIGVGQQIEPRSVGQSGPWSSTQAVIALRKEQERVA